MSGTGPNFNYRVQTEFKAANALTPALQSIMKAAAQVSSVIGKTDRKIAAMTANFEKLASSTNVASTSMARFGAVANESLLMANARSAGLTRSMGGVAAEASLATRAFTAVGVAAGVSMAIGIKGASDLQNATLQGAIAMSKMGANIDQTMSKMASFRTIALSMSQITGQSMAESMGVIATMSSAGVSGPQIQKMWKPLAQYADVLHFGKDKMDYGAAAGLGAGLAHDFRSFNEKDLTFALGSIAQAGYLSPHGTMQLATQARQMAPGLMNVLPGSVQQRTSQIIELTAWADRMGGLQRSGAGISQLVRNMINPRSKRAFSGLQDLGIFDSHGKNRFFNQKTGEFDMMGALGQVQKRYDTAQNAPGGRGRVVTDLMAIDANASRYLQLLTSKESLTAYKAVRSQHSAMGDPGQWMARTQEQYMGTLSAQTQLLTSNFKTLTSLLAEQLIPPLTGFVSFLAKLTGGASNTFAKDPVAAGFVGTALAGGGILGTIKALQMGVSVFAGTSEHIGGTKGAHAYVGFRNIAKILGPMGAQAGIDAASMDRLTLAIQRQAIGANIATGEAALVGRTVGGRFLGALSAVISAPAIASILFAGILGARLAEAIPKDLKWNSRLKQLQDVRPDLARQFGPIPLMPTAHSAAKEKALNDALYTANRGKQALQKMYDVSLSHGVAPILAGGTLTAPPWSAPQLSDHTFRNVVRPPIELPHVSRLPDTFGNSGDKQPVMSFTGPMNFTFTGPTTPDTVKDIARQLRDLYPSAKGGTKPNFRNLNPGNISPAGGALGYGP